MMRAAIGQDNFWRKALAHQQFAKFSDSDGVLVLGPTGSGKSTAISTQVGCDFKKEGLKHVLVRKVADCPMISTRTLSQTLHVSVWKDQADDLCYFDTPGFGENRIGDAPLFAKNSIHYLMRTAKAIRAIIVVVSYSALGGAGAGGDRASGLRKLLAEIEPFLEVESSDDGATTGDNSFVYQNMIMLVTHLPHGAAESDVREAATTVLEDDKTLLEQSLANLRRKYGLSMAEAMAAKAKQSGRALSPYQEIHWAKVPSADKKEVAYKDSCIKFLECFLRAPLVLSTMENPAACQKQRLAVRAAIGRVPGIAPNQIRRLCAGCGHSALEFQRKLVELAGCFQVDLGAHVKTLKKMKLALEGKQTILQAIEENPEAARGVLIQKNSEDLRSLKVKIDSATTYVENKSNSTSRVVDNEVHVKEDRGWSFLWMVGGTAECTKRFSASATIQKAEINRGRGCLSSNSSPSFSGSSGSWYFKSNTATDLNVRFDVYVYEKDLPATITAVKACRDRLEKFQEEKRKKDENHLVLAATDKIGLRKYVVEEMGALEVALAAQKGFFEEEFESGTFQEQSLTGLVALFKHLVDHHCLLDTKLAPAERETVTAFQTSYRDLQVLRTNPLLLAYVPNPKTFQATTPLAPENEEVDRRVIHASVLEKATATAKTGVQATVMQAPSIEQIKSFVLKNPLMCAVVGFAAFVSQAQGPFWGLVLVLSCVCVALFCMQLCNRTVKALSDLVNGAGKNTDRLFREALIEAKVTRELSAETITEVSRIFAQKLNVDLKTNIDTQGMTSFTQSDNRSIFGGVKALTAM